jgi:hypothetical protein
MKEDIVNRLKERFTVLDDHLRDVIDDAIIAIENLRWIIKEQSNTAVSKIEELEEALKFYGNEKNYYLEFRKHPSMGDYETSRILDDNGSIARDVLKTYVNKGEK